MSSCVEPYDTHLPYEILKTINIPGDLDTGSQAYMWATERSSSAYAQDFSDYRAAYLAQLSQWVDSGRSQQHSNDAGWKSSNSGAFMTWYEPDSINLPGSRIPGGINDVDCVVNLNVLHSLATAATLQEQIPDATLTGETASCQVIQQMIQNQATDRCAVYYRQTQVFLAFGRALAGGVDCLQSVQDDAGQQAEALSEQLLLSRQTDVVELIEMTIALKSVYPAPSRSAAVATTIANLEAQLASELRDAGHGGKYLPEGLLFKGFLPLLNGHAGITSQWYSQAMSTAEGLWALTLP